MRIGRHRASRYTGKSQLGIPAGSETRCSGGSFSSVVQDLLDSRGVFETIGS